MKTAEIRQRFLDFFVERGHRLVESAPLVPHDDPTLLFTTAGMVPFKRYYDGTVEVPFRRATSCQKCLRVKGKASDLENVGRTVRHMTFFEMLGNFSFGDYFKREAIAWAWEFSTQVMGLPAERLWATIYEEDDEAGEIWAREIGLPRGRIIKMGRKDNFWGPAGETGACGPCSELLFDRGEAFGPCDPATNDERFLEFWNLVFPQFDYIESNPTRPLKNRGIDTGMGLERLAMLVQGKNSIFETDGLWPACEHLAQLVGRPHSESPEVAMAINACVDHTRCLTFAISEGIIPSNEGRGYVMRAIIRRAIRLYKTRLHFPQPVLFHLVDDFIDALGDVYPQIKVGVEHTREVIRHEEERFLRTVDMGESYLGRALEAITRSALTTATQQLGGVALVQAPETVGSHGLRPDFVAEFPDRSRFIAEIKVGRGGLAAGELYSASSSGDSPHIHQLKTRVQDLLEIPGETVFRLYDTYGFPVEMTSELAKDLGVRTELEGFLRAMEQQRAKARAAWKGAELAESEKIFNPVAEQHGGTEFLGYETLTAQADVLALARDGAIVSELRQGEQGEVILDQTPFYAESGGQVGDTGTLTHGDAVFTVRDTQKTTHGLFRHLGVMTRGALATGQVVLAEVDSERRMAIRRHHTATHLLNAALRRHLGSHVKQAGSLVAPDYLRFDFTHTSAIDPETLAKIEATVCEHVMADHLVQTDVLPIAEARKRGAVAVFGEKYGEIVRVLTMGPESIEFCGGTHLERTGQVGPFVITAESSIAAGTRRIEALAGEPAVRWLQATRARQDRLSRALSIKPEELEARLAAMQEEIKQLRRELSELRQAQSAAAVRGARAIAVDGHSVVAQRLEASDPADLRGAIDAARQGRARTVVVLGAVIGGRVALATGVTPDCLPRLHAGKLLGEVAKILGGKGGGRPDLAQGGGGDPAKLDEALAQVPAIVGRLLGAG